MQETDSSVSVTLSPTVPVSCPPCSVTVRLINPVGLTVSTCSLTFTADQPLSGQTVNIRAVPTAGSNSRTAHLQFHTPLYTHVTGSGWDDYTIAQLQVSTYLFVLTCTCWPTEGISCKYLYPHQNYWDFHFQYSSSLFLKQFTVDAAEVIVCHCPLTATVVKNIWLLCRWYDAILYVYIGADQRQCSVRLM